MASTTAHSIVGSALALPVLGYRTILPVIRRWGILIFSGLLAAAPDLDLVGRRALGIPLTSVLSHRGLFHSPFFLILFTAVPAGIATRGRSRKAFRELWLLWTVCALTHPLLDAMTDGGRGVMLLLPFSSARLYLPWRPIHTPPGSTENILSRAWLLRASEIPFCVAALLIGVSALLIRRRANRSIQSPR